jgi:Radical SAM superfamily
MDLLDLMQAPPVVHKAPPLNADGISVKGCEIIYAPKGQAGEYAPLATNPYRGCGHGCAYCYVPRINHQERKEFDAGAVSREDYLLKLRKDARKYRAAGIREQVMLSFSTDVYNPNNRELTRPAIEILIEYGLGFCVLTKGGTRALADRDLYRADRDAFASTLTSLDERFSRKWERNAALPDDRLAALRQFHDRGIFTWVSLEPTLDVDSSLAIVEAAHGFVDFWKVGRANYLPMTQTTDWRSYTLRIIDLLNRLGARHYVKRDLQPYLPAGYANPMRVPQHH